MNTSQILKPCLILLTGTSPLLLSDTLYWDTNGTTAGSGNSAGTWDTGSTANWNLTPDGTGTPQTWADGDSAVFSAGTDGTGTKTITLSGTIKTPSILLEELALITLSGGSIDITGGSNFNTSVLGAATGRSLTWNSTITGTGNLTIASHGSTADSGEGSNSILFLTGSNNFLGDVTISSGVVHANSNLGNSANKVILNGGGVIDNNQNINFTRDIQVDSGFTGIYRTWGSVTTGQISGAILGSGTLRHTDGGTLTLSGDGSAFTGTYNNARGNTLFTTSDWSGTKIVNSDGSSVRFNATGESSILSYAGDRDVYINGSRLNIVSGEMTVAAGTANNNFWVQGAGTLTSESGTLTLDWNVPYVTAGDQAIRVIVEDYDVATPLTVVKDGVGGIARYDKANTYPGGTIINGGRIAAQNIQAFGSGTVTTTADPVTGIGGQAWLSVGGTFANDFDISGIGSTETVGELGAIRFGNNSISGSVTVSNDARIVAYSGTTGTITGNLLGSGNLEINIASDLSANGTINLNGNATTYNGTIEVSRGRLNMLSDTAGSLFVGDAGTYNGENTFAGNITLGTTGGASLIADGASPAALTASGNIVLNGISNVTLNNPQSGPNLIAAYGGTLTGNAANLDITGGLGAYRTGTAFDTTTLGSIFFNVVNDSITWTGSTNGNWNTNTTQNWLNSASSADNFFTADNVTFDNSGSSQTSVTLVGNVSPASITVNSTSGTADYTITGSAGNVISGSSSLLKDGSSTLTINAPNTFSGGTAISEGTINIRQAGSLGTGSVTLGDASTGSADVALYLDSARSNFGNQVVISNQGTGTATIGSLSTVGGTGDNNQFTNIVLQRDIIFDSNANDRTDYENISGTGNVTITGNGRTIFITPNSFTGDVTVAPTGGGNFQTGTATGGNQNFIPDTSNLIVKDTNNGTVAEFRLSSGGETIAGLSGDGDIGVNSVTGRLSVGFGDATSTFDGRFQSTIGLTKIGNGTLTLTGASTNNQPTNIDAGTLIVSNTSGSATGSGNVNVASGAFLAGDGEIDGNVSLGGTILVGQNGLVDRTLTINGNITTNPGSSLSFTVDSMSNHDQLIVGVGSSISLTNAHLDVSFDPSFTLTSLAAGEGSTFLSQLDSYSGSATWIKLIDGDTTGMFTNVTTTMSASELAYFDLSGTQYKTTIEGRTFWVAQGSTYLVAIPEPQTALIGLLSALLTLRRRRA